MERLPAGRFALSSTKWDIDVGQNILQQINQALTFCRYFAVVISPEFLAAPWPAPEWTHMVSDDPTNRKGRLIPLFFRDYSSALAAHAELPAPFKALNWIDFRRLADFRSSFQKLVRKLRDQPPAREGGGDRLLPFRLQQCRLPRRQTIRRQLPIESRKPCLATDCRLNHTRQQSGVCLTDVRKVRTLAMPLTSRPPSYLKRSVSIPSLIFLTKVNVCEQLSECRESSQMLSEDGRTTPFVGAG